MGGFNDGNSSSYSRNDIQSVIDNTARILWYMFAELQILEIKSSNNYMVIIDGRYYSQLHSLQLTVLSS